MIVMNDGSQLEELSLCQSPISVVRFLSNITFEIMDNNQSTYRNPNLYTNPNTGARRPDGSLYEAPKNVVKFEYEDLLLVEAGAHPKYGKNYFEVPKSPGCPDDVAENIQKNLARQGLTKK
mmetsp:Transcript_35372/g.45410  ORF Transcript_35372/g.45410 Transcript_35372/m.45410 type:complete len:121 (+) Transcript_35372:2-364(+)